MFSGYGCLKNVKMISKQYFFIFQINDLMYSSLQEGEQNITKIIKDKLLSVKKENNQIWDTRF